MLIILWIFSYYSLIISLTWHIHQATFPYMYFVYLCALWSNRNVFYLAGSANSSGLSIMLEEFSKSFLWTFLLSPSEFIHQCDFYFWGQAFPFRTCFSVTLFSWHFMFLDGTFMVTRMFYKWLVCWLVHFHGCVGL